MSPTLLKLSCLLPCFALCGCNITFDSGLQGSGISAEETREIGTYSRLRIEVPADVEVTKSDSVSMVITGDDNHLPLIETKIEGDELRITATENLDPVTPLQIKLTIPELTAVEVLGSGDVLFESMDTENAVVSITGSGSVTGPVAASELKATLTGSGDISLTGSAAELKVTVVGPGSVDLGKLEASSAECQVTGPGDIIVAPTDKLKAGVTGPGDIACLTSPEDVTKSVTGPGDITIGSGAE